MNQIEHFVRKTLGCQCPDEVFRSISIDRRHGGDGAIPYTRLVVGDRLLIYVLEATSGHAGGSAMSNLIAGGRRERDAGGYNRFRLVVSCDEAEPTGAAARHAFENEAGDDDKAHFHAVPRAALPPGIAP
jgi:hypothetical protein